MLFGFMVAVKPVSDEMETGGRISVRRVRRPSS